jgi:hypothetical protein
MDPLPSLSSVIHSAADSPITPSPRRRPQAPSVRKTQNFANPFRIPPDKELFALRDEQRIQREINHNKMGTSSYYERSPRSPRATFRKLAEVPNPKISPEEQALSHLILAPDPLESQEGLRDYVNQKREIFMAQLAVDTQREELQRIERLEREEQDGLNRKESEIALFREQFRAFLDADAKSLIEARQVAEAKSKQRIEVARQVKMFSQQISALRSDIRLLEDKLQDCEGFKCFLEGLTPVEWRQRHPFPEIYFKDPGQLVEVMQILQDQNTFLLTHCEEAEEFAARCKETFRNRVENRDREIDAMIDQSQADRRRLMETQAQNLQYKTSGKFRHGNEIPKPEYIELADAISQFHQELGFEGIGQGGAVTMLKRIEFTMEDLFIKLAQRDRNAVGDLYKDKLHYRADEERLAKAERKQKEQEEKTQRSIALATMPIKRRYGRPLVKRMTPHISESREKLEEMMKLQTAQKAADQNLLYAANWD